MSMNGIEDQRLSRSLFDQVKPYCTQLSQETTVTTELNENKITSLLTTIESILTDHYKEHHEGVVYRLVPNIADYIFFPISNLLKQTHLSGSIVQHILNVLSFLLNYCWIYNPNYALIDQLYPLILYLSEKGIQTKSVRYKLAVVGALSSIVNAVDDSYFQVDKRLMYLSNTITVALEITTSVKPNVQETIELILNSIQLVISLMKLLTSSQISMILPGVVSSITKFVSQTPSLNHQIIINLLNLVSLVICSSFNDKELNAKFNSNSIENLSDLDAVWDDDEKTLDETPINDIIISENDNRSLSWLKATSKQLKITLVILFKSLIQRNKNRLQTNKNLNNEVLRFVITILKDCFISLYTDLVSLLLDILSLLIFSSYEENDRIFEIIDQLLSTIDTEEKQKALFDLVKSKLSDQIEKLSSIIFSIDEDKVKMNIIALKFDFALFRDLSRILDVDHTEFNYSKSRCLNLLQEYIVDNHKFENQRIVKKHSSSGITDDRLNTIELPSYINMKGIKTQKSQNETPYINNLQILARKWTANEIFNSSQEENPDFLSNIVQDFIQFLSSLDKSHLMTDLESILESSDDLLNRSVSLWIGSTFIKNHLEQVGNFDFSEFLVDSIEVDNEVSSLILLKAEEIISEVDMNSPNEYAFTSALQAIGTTVGTISLPQFRTDFLMDYLLPMFQALTLNNHPQIQQQAQITIKKVLDTYYQGSMVNLIMDNQDYLIDSISLQMSIASQLTPMLPGILLIIIKVAGIQLLESNQLNDVISDMFVIIDSYHGYNKIVESFFIVFQVLIEQIIDRYKIDLQIESDPKVNKSLFKPWGMTNKEQLIEFLSSKPDPTQYESGKEYFKRPADKPFSEMKDSDDEDSDDEGLQEKEEEPWSSPIPKNIYMMLQKVFTYGFVLISQPSYSLKSQIIKTLNLIYPLLCTNYNQVLPVITTNWSVLIALITGSKSLSSSITNVNSFSPEEINLIIQSLEFVIKILQQDRDKEEFFFSRKFQETWEFIKNYSLLKPDPQFEVSKNAIYTFRSYPKLKHSLINFLIMGVQNYEKQISDIKRYGIIKLCYQLSIPQDIPLTRDTMCIIEVLKN